MFVIDTAVPTGAEMLAELGFNARAIRQILDDPAVFEPRGDEAERKEGLKQVRRRGLPWCSSGADATCAVSGAALASVLSSVFADGLGTVRDQAAANEPRRVSWTPVSVGLATTRLENRDVASPIAWDSMTYAERCPSLAGAPVRLPTMPRHDLERDSGQRTKQTILWP